MELGELYFLVVQFEPITNRAAIFSLDAPWQEDSLEIRLARDRLPPQLVERIEPECGGLDQNFRTRHVRHGLNQAAELVLKLLEVSELREVHQLNRCASASSFTARRCDEVAGVKLVEYQF